MKIVIFGGTTEGRKLVEIFKNMDITVSVATEYGAKLLPNNINVVVGKMNFEKMIEFLKDFDIVIDSTHPYALEVTENLYNASKVLKKEYIRLLRNSSEYKNCIYVDNIKESVKLLNQLEGNILAVTGSKQLVEYTYVNDYRNRIFLRVLPTIEAISKCINMNFKIENIIAMQGPFIFELNYAIMKQYNIKILVTKDGGQAGGFDEKILAAEKIGANIIVIGRPFQRDGISFDEIVSLIKAKQTE